MTPAERVELPMGDLLTAVVTRCPADDPANLAKIERFWASLRPCDGRD